MAIGAGNTMLLAAVLPQLTREMAMPDWMAGAVFSLSALLWSLTSPFWGKASNTWGRRRIAAIGLGGYALSMFLIWLTGTLALAGVMTSMVTVFICLALARSLFGLLGSAANPAAQAYVADRTSKAERQGEIAFLSSGFSVGTVIGPAFAASHLEILSVLALSYWLFDERIGMPQIIGCLFIVAGIACLAVSETQEAEGPGADDDTPGHAGGNPGAGSASAGAAHLAASAEHGTHRG
jgi:MFS family permease